MKLAFWRGLRLSSVAAGRSRRAGLVWPQCAARVELVCWVTKRLNP